MESAEGQTAFFAPRPVHSRKPEEMREMIETASHAPRLELFARARCQGWNVWGNEVQPDVQFIAIRGAVPSGLTIPCRDLISPSDHEISVVGSAISLVES
jgi:hypothetical protein